MTNLKIPLDEAEIPRYDSIRSRHGPLIRAEQNMAGKRLRNLKTF